MSTLVSLPIDQLAPAADNVRRDVGDVTELAASITALGLLQPVVATNGTADGTYTLVAGHRRLAAALQAGLTEIPAIVTELDEAGRVEAMLVENLQREDIDPLEEADGFQRLIALGRNQRDIARRVGRSQSHVSKRVALLNLPAPAQAALDSGRITVGQAEELAKIDPKRVTKVVAGDGPVSSWKIDEAVRDEENEKKRDEARKRAADLGLPEITRKESYTDTWDRVTGDDFAQADAVCITDYGQLLAYRKVTPKKKSVPSWQKDQAAREKRAKALEASHEQRAAWIRNHLTSGRLDAKTAQAYVNQWIVKATSQYYVEVEGEIACGLLGLKLAGDDDGNGQPDDPGPVMTAYAVRSDRNALRAALACALAAGEQDAGNLAHRSTSGGLDEELEAHYAYLAAHGYVPDKVEAAELARVRPKDKPAAAS